MNNKDNKTELVTLRVTVAQKIQLKKLAETYKSVGEFIRRKLGLDD